MSTRRNYSRNRGRNYTDPTPIRHNTKYQPRGGKKNSRPEPNRRQLNGDDVDSLMTSIGRHLTTGGNPSKEFFSTARTKGPRPLKKKSNSSTPQIAWWRITVKKAGTIGKERVMAALQARCLRPFQPYHVNNHLFTKLKFLICYLFL
jgi:hypothetical protein